MDRCIGMLYWIEKHPGLASWVQAIGSIIAIGIAIWVPYWQKKQAHEQARQAEADQVRHLLRNLLDEIIVVSSGFREQNGKLLLETTDGSPFMYVVPVMDNPFPIYNASTAKLGQIPDDELRRHLITGYGYASAFVSSIRFNNLLLQRFAEAKYLASIHDDDIHRGLQESQHTILAQYGHALKRSYNSATEKLQLAQDAMEAALGMN